MTVFVDDPMTQIKGKFRNYCHMWTDGTLEGVNELDAFAVKKLGLSIEWRQYTRGVFEDFFHYDISPLKRKVALDRGAEYMPLAKWIESVREKVIKKTLRSILSNPIGALGFEQYLELSQRDQAVVQALEVMGYLERKEGYGEEFIGKNLHSIGMTVTFHLTAKGIAKERENG